MLTDAEKVDVRRHCGFEAYGSTASGNAGWRFFQQEGLLEYRMNNLSAAEEGVVRTNYLTPLNAMELAIVGVSDGGAADIMGTAVAGPWERNANEGSDRRMAFDDWRRRLCRFLGLPPGPGLATGGRCVV